MLLTQIICDRHVLSVKDTDRSWQTETKTFGDRQRLSVTNTDYLLLNQTVCARHRPFVTDTERSWLTQTDCCRHKHLVRDIDSLWRAHNLCGRQRLLVTDADCLLQTRTFCARKIQWREPRYITLQRVRVFGLVLFMRKDVTREWGRCEIPVPVENNRAGPGPGQKVVTNYFSSISKFLLIILCTKKYRSLNGDKYTNYWI